jgi:hypothetical protein
VTFSRNESPAAAKCDAGFFVFPGIEILDPPKHFPSYRRMNDKRIKILLSLILVTLIVIAGLLGVLVVRVTSPEGIPIHATLPIRTM